MNRIQTISRFFNHLFQLIFLLLPVLTALAWYTASVGGEGNLSYFIQALLSVVLTWHNPQGERMVVISLTEANISIVLTGFMIILIAWIMEEAQQLKDDQQLTI